MVPQFRYILSFHNFAIYFSSKILLQPSGTHLWLFFLVVNTGFDPLLYGPLEINNKNVPKKIILKICKKFLVMNKLPRRCFLVTGTESVWWRLRQKQVYDSRRIVPSLPHEHDVWLRWFSLVCVSLVCSSSPPLPLFAVSAMTIAMEFWSDVKYINNLDNNLGQAACLLYVYSLLIFLSSYKFFCNSISYTIWYCRFLSVKDQINSYLIIC